MPLFTADELRARIETDVADAILLELQADAEATIAEKFGATVLLVDAEGALVYLNGRRASALTTIVENDVTLASNDYELVNGGLAIRRLNTGTNAATSWGSQVRVTFTPYDDEAKRKRVVVDLVKLGLLYNGGLPTAQGDFETSGSISAGAYETERERLLHSLRPAMGFYA